MSERNHTNSVGICVTARWLSRLPALLLGSVFTVILSFCVAADYPRLCALLRDKVPPGLTALLGELRYFGSRVLLRMSLERKSGFSPVTSRAWWSVTLPSSTLRRRL